MAVEFSFVVALPLMLVTFGTVEAGRMVVAKEECAYAATVGARTAVAKVAVQGGSTVTVTAAVVQAAAVAAAPLLHLATSNVSVAVTGSTTTFANRTRGDKVTVTVTYTFTPMVPVLTKLTSKSYTVKSAMVIP